MKMEELPQEILAKIVSYLPTNEAIHTSLVSPSLRQSWKETPSMRFDVSDPGLTRVVDRCLLLHKGPITELSLRISHETSTVSLGVWIDSAAERNLRTLHIKAYTIGGTLLTLPKQVFAHTKVESIILKGPLLIQEQFPEVKEMMSLRHLELNGVVYSSEQISKILDLCTSLESLVLKRNGRDKFALVMPSLLHLYVRDLSQSVERYSVQCPQLVTFSGKLRKFPKGLFSSCKSLSSLHLHGTSVSDSDFPVAICFPSLTNFSCIALLMTATVFNQLLEAMPSIQVLTLRLIPYLSCDDASYLIQSKTLRRVSIDQCRAHSNVSVLLNASGVTKLFIDPDLLASDDNVFYPPKLPELQELAIGTSEPNWWKWMDVFEASSNLKSLKLETKTADGATMRPSHSYSFPLFPNLERLLIKDFDGSKSQKHFLRHILVSTQLEKATVLTKFPTTTKKRKIKRFLKQMSKEFEEFPVDFQV